MIQHDEPTDRATLADLEEAEAALQRWEDRWANDSSNNPNRFHAERQAARERVRLLKRAVKIQGDLPMTPSEQFAHTLDQLHPSARHGGLVEHLAVSMRRHCSPAQRSRAGNVMSWDCTWVAAEPRS